jgi:hypothetical protein
MRHRGDPASQSGQAVLLGVLALLLLGTSIAASLNYVGNRATLGRKQAGVYQTTPVSAALRAFVARNFRLPCPADGSVAKGSASDGVEAVNGNLCTISGRTGVVPWKTLGISYVDALDRFGARLGYAVSPQLSSPLYIPTTQISFLTTPKETLNTYDKVAVQTCSTSCTSTGLYAYAVISYGKDRAGAYMTSGSRVTSPGSTTREYPNALDAAFNGSGAFEVWPYNESTTAGTSYFDDVVVYQTASALVDDLNFDNNNVDNRDTDTNPTYGNPNSNTNAPAKAGQNTDAAAQSSNSSTITNTYSCASGSNYCPGSTNSGSLANTYAYAGCSGNSCTDASNGECLNLVGNLGVVCVHDPLYHSGIFVGNATQNGDWVGPNHANSCSECSVPGTVNYMVPTQTLIYNLTNTYKSFAFVDYLVDGGQQVLVNAYQSEAYSVTADLGSGSTTISNVQPDTTGLAVGQSVTNVTYFPNFTTITGVVDSHTITVSRAPSTNATGASLTILQNSFQFTGNLTSGSNEIDNIQAVTNNLSASTGMLGLSTGFAITGPGIPAGTTITAVSSAGLSVTTSAPAIATSSGAALFMTPWTKVGTRIISDSYQTNMADALTISGISTSGSTSLTNVAPATTLAAGQLITGPGIQPGTIIAAVDTTLSGTTLTLSRAAVQSNTGYFYVATTDRVTAPATGDLTSGSTTVANVSSTTGITVGQAIAGTYIQAGTTVAGVSSNALTLSSAATATATGQNLFFTTRLPNTGITGNITSGSQLITNVSNTTGFIGNEHIDSPALPSGTYITAVASSTSLSISQAATATQTGANLYVIPLSPTVSGVTGDLLSGSGTITNVSSTTGLLPGEVIAATGLPSGTYIVSIPGANQLTVSQNATATATGTSLIFVKGTPIIGTTGDVTNNSQSVTNVSPSTGIEAGQFIDNTNLQESTTVTTAASGALSISQKAIGTETAAALTTGYYPPAATATMTGTLVSGSSSVTNLPTSSLPGVGTMVNGLGIPSGTMSTAISGTTMTLSQSATLSQSSAIHASYPVCPGPQTSLGGIFAATQDERGQTAQYAPIVQHPPASIAAGIHSQVWPQPTTPSALGGNYVDQRDYQFPNVQFFDSSGKAIKFNVLVLEVLPYVYASGAVHQYGMLFEGAKGCYTDINSARCTMQGIDEWWNPPVLVTSDCGQYPQ